MEDNISLIIWPVKALWTFSKLNMYCALNFKSVQTQGMLYCSRVNIAQHQCRESSQIVNMVKIMVYFKSRRCSITKQKNEIFIYESTSDSGVGLTKWNQFVKYEWYTLIDK